MLRGFTLNATLQMAFDEMPEAFYLEMSTDLADNGFIGRGLMDRQQEK